MASSMLFKIALISCCLIVATAGDKKKAAPTPADDKKAAPAPAGDSSSAANATSASAASGGSGVFDVTKYSASTSASASANSKAFTDAFKAACAFKGQPTVSIPAGTYQLGPVVFEGPCIGSHITFDIKGTLVAIPDNSAFPGPAWLEFDALHELVVQGGGIIDGQGKASWTQGGKDKAINMRFMKCNNGKITGITSKDSKFFHFALHNSQGLIFDSVKVVAPWDSKNTDGIHMSMSSNITLNAMDIGTGDDCISIGQGTNNVQITGCNIGSLGKVPNEQNVGNIHVKSCTVQHTSNGVRIKTWPGAPPSEAFGITFEDITMTNVSNPIIIDQLYCPDGECTNKNPSNVKIRDITFSGVKGTSNTEVAVKLACSEKVPCTNVILQDIALQPTGTGCSKVSSLCTNVQGGVKGTIKPDPCIGAGAGKSGGNTTASAPSSSASASPPAKKAKKASS
ncbi:exopolygalacturonase-like protein [Carex littledalei]|uniref:Exopolygalacturonase-like protein n=1 Tax=Carex littledalei TaxID=544730 RepID=A0A833RB74_9POAL|nr:exopolygalacturonase-like protein [Carex littledalei]